MKTAINIADKPQELNNLENYLRTEATKAGLDYESHIASKVHASGAIADFFKKVLPHAKMTYKSLSWVDFANLLGRNKTSLCKLANMKGKGAVNRTNKPAAAPVDTVEFDEDTHMKIVIVNRLDTFDLITSTPKTRIIEIESYEFQTISTRVERAKVLPSIAFARGNSIKRRTA